MAFGDNAADQVADGMRILDEYGPPEWWDRIDLEKLSIHSAWDCVLGQVFQDKADETGYLTGYIWATESGDLPFTDRELQYAGFCGNSSAKSLELNLAWGEAIINRRAEVNA